MTSSQQLLNLIKEGKDIPESFRMIKPKILSLNIYTIKH